MILGNPPFWSGPFRQRHTPFALASFVASHTEGCAKPGSVQSSLPSLISHSFSFILSQMSQVFLVTLYIFFSSFF